MKTSTYKRLRNQATKIRMFRRIPQIPLQILDVQVQFTNTMSMLLEADLNVFTANDL